MPPLEVDTPRFGYGLYKVSVGNAYIFVDFRDADYGPFTGYEGNGDMELSYTPGKDYFSSAYHRDIPLYTTYTIWYMLSKQGAVKIPVTVRNSFDGGYGGIVKVDGVMRSSPYETTWEIGNHTVEAYQYQQQKEYYFDYWSDGGARAHTVVATVEKFGLVLTAYYSGPHKGLAENTSPIQESFTAYPNPFNPTTTIRYGLAHRSLVSVRVYDILARQIAVLENGSRNAGQHEVRFDASGLPSGVYYYRLQIDNQTTTRCMLLLK